MDAMLGHEDGILHAPTGSGKNRNGLRHSR